MNNKIYKVFKYLKIEKNNNIYEYKLIIKNNNLIINVFLNGECIIEGIQNNSKYFLDLYIKLKRNENIIENEFFLIKKENKIWKETK